MGKQIISTVFAAAIIATFGQLLFSLTPDQRSVVRRYENEAKKLNNAKHAVVYNELCVQENLLPKYSNIKLHDRAVQHEDFVIDFRKRLTTEQLSRKKEHLTKLTEDVAKCRADFDQLDVNPEAKRKISDCLSAILSDHVELARSRVLKKLSDLYKGDICIPKEAKGFVNLSSVRLSPEQEEFLNLGLNCHYFPKFDPITKKTEVAILFEDICTKVISVSQQKPRVSLTYHPSD